MEHDKKIKISDRYKLVKVPIVSPQDLEIKKYDKVEKPLFLHIPKKEVK